MSHTINGKRGARDLLGRTLSTKLRWVLRGWILQHARSVELFSGPRNIDPFFTIGGNGIFRTQTVCGTFSCLDERMQRKRSFRRAPLWQRPQGPTISILREGARARLDFEYSPTRVAAVKAIKGAKYHPEDKSWTIPFESVDSILTHKEFPSYRSLNGLGERGLTPSTERVRAVSYAKIRSPLERRRSRRLRLTALCG